MASHGGAGEDNPVSLNVAPMVDIIFCLCIFFMCSFHFKQLEGKFESWLPKNRGVHPEWTDVPLEEIRVIMTCDPAVGEVTRRVNSNIVASDEELLGLVLAALSRFQALGKTDVPVILDATPGVPWKEVIRVMDLCKRNRIEKIELAAPMPAAK